MGGYGASVAVGDVVQGWALAGQEHCVLIPWGGVLRCPHWKIAGVWQLLSVGGGWGKNVTTAMVCYLFVTFGGPPKSLTMAGSKWGSRE